MRARRRVVGLVIAAVGSVCLSGVCPTGPAAAEIGTPRPLAGFSDLQVAGGLVFLSQGEEGGLRVLDAEGADVTTIDALTGAYGLSLRADGSTLLVALPAQHRIAAVDTGTLDIASFDAGVDSAGEAACPGDVVEDGGLLWFTSACPFRVTRLDVLDPTTGETHHDVSDVPFPWGELLTSSSHPGRLWLGDRSYPASYKLFTLTATPEPAATLVAQVDDVPTFADLALTPDGATVVTSTGARFAVDDAAELTPLTPTFVRSGVATSTDGATAFSGNAGTRGVSVLRPDGTLMRGYAWPESEVPVAQGLGFAGGRLFVVSFTDRGLYDYVIREWRPGLDTGLRVTTDRARYDHGDTASVTVRLTGGDTNRKVTLLATPWGRRRHWVGTREVDGLGVARFEVPVTRRTRFEARYAGDDAWEPADDSTSVGVAARLQPWMRQQTGRDGRYYLYGRGRTLVGGSTVAPRHPGDCLAFRVQLRDRGSWRDLLVLPCTPLDSSSKATVRIRWVPRLVGVPLRIRARWPGDDESLARTGDWRYARFTA